MLDKHWIDEELSNELPAMRSRGEGQTLEYKSEFPSNAQAIGREIAAFATSGGGMILIGVNDSGDLAGVQNIDTPVGRDNLMKRIEGVCNGQVKPAVTPTLSFLAESGKLVVAIIVPKGTQPVYYCNSIPYIRHLSSSRPAEPHEVVELIRRWSDSRPVETPDTSAASQFLTTLAMTLTEILVVAPEIGERSLNPWLEATRAQFRYAAETLRGLATTDSSIEFALNHQLDDLAGACDAVAGLRLYLGPESYQSLLTVVNEAASQAAALMALAIESRDLTKRAALDAQGALRVSMRRLDGLLSRMDSMVQEGNIEDLQSEASRIGADILRLTFLGLNHVLGIDINRLQGTARTLHLTETQRVYLDGGASVNKIVSQISQSASEIAAIAAESEVQST